jgi:hypothetical protein
MMNRDVRRVRAEVVEKRAARDSDTAMALWCSLVSTRRCEASDVRDKVFAVLGVVEDRQWTPPFFPIDYTITVQQLFREVATCHRLLAESQLLAGWRPTQQATIGLPSWCSDWVAQKPLLNDLANLCDPELSTYSRWRDAVMSFGPHVDSMTVTGACIGQCDTVTGQIDMERLPWYQHLCLSSLDLWLRGRYSAAQQTHIATWERMLALSDLSLGAVEMIGSQPHTMANSARAARDSSYLPTIRARVLPRS